MLSIFFHAGPFSISKSRNSSPNSNGCVYPAVSRIADLRGTFNQTGNRGNAVHAEAPQKLFEHNLRSSCTGNIVSFFDADPDGFERNFNAKFDMVILSLANFIRKGQDHSRILAVLRLIHVPIVVFSAGIQSRLADFSPLDDSTVELIKFFNQSAVLFSVRGAETAAFLNENGINNIVELGCPSLYVYPRNILSISPLNSQGALKLAVAGHFSEENLTKKTSKSKRADEFYVFLRSLVNFSALNISSIDYVFQDEVFTFKELQAKYSVFDDALCCFSSKEISSYLKSISERDFEFIRKWFMFPDAATWRQYMSSRDLYVGDRFHGGVVALQAGVPALIVSGDLRVQELTEFFAIPSVNFSDLRGVDFSDVLSEKLSKKSLNTFHHNYRERYSKFQMVCREVGLNIVDPLS